MSDENGLKFILNARETSADAKPSVTLLGYLRSAGHVGTKEGCGDGDCGACTVAIIGKNSEGEPQYQAVNSCLVPLGSVIGKEVVTVEGVANGGLHPVQAAMVETGGSQCGYCTPGFVMSLFSGYYSGELDDIAVEGNLCRCTGYLPIRKAARSLGKPDAEDDFIKKLDARSEKLEGGSHPQFYRPSNLFEVFEALEEHPEATLIAGGTDLGLELSHKTREFPVLISLEDVEELHFIDDSEAELELGAGLPLTHIEKKCRGAFPALDEMIHWFAARQIRNRATLGGNIGTASPIGDLPPVLLALDASVKLASKGAERTVPLAEFFTGYRQTVLQPGEIIVSVDIPKAMKEGAARRLSQSYKIGKRGTDDISIVAAAFMVDLDASEKIVHARLAYGGVAATPVRATEVEAFLMGKPWTEKTVLGAKTHLQQTFQPLDDLRGSAAYRNKLVGNLFHKFFIDFARDEVAV